MLVLCTEDVVSQKIQTGKGVRCSVKLEEIMQRRHRKRTVGTITEVGSPGSSANTPASRGPETVPLPCPCSISPSFKTTVMDHPHITTSFS